MKSSHNLTSKNFIQDGSFFFSICNSKFGYILQYVIFWFTVLLVQAWKYLLNLLMTNFKICYICRHGILQFLTPWSDGPEYVTQCPIPPGGSYTYQFNLTGQEGTLWWHAHSSFLRATVYGALVIRPPRGHLYPFKFYQDFPILLGIVFFSPINIPYLLSIIAQFLFH